MEHKSTTDSGILDSEETNLEPETTPEPEPEPTTGVPVDTESTDSINLAENAQNPDESTDATSSSPLEEETLITGLDENVQTTENTETLAEENFNEAESPLKTLKLPPVLISLRR